MDGKNASDADHRKHMRPAAQGLLRPAEVCLGMNQQLPAKTGLTRAVAPNVIASNGTDLAVLPHVLTITEVATFLRVSKATVSKLARGQVRGVAPLPVVRLGRRIIVRRDAFLDWLCQQSTGSVVR